MKNKHLRRLLAGAVALSLVALAGGVASASVYKSAVLADSPMAYWPLDETSGNVFYDAANSNDSNPFGGGIVLNKPGALASGEPAAEFIPPSGSAHFPTVAGLRDNFSVEFWLNPDTRSNYNQQIGADSGWDKFTFHTGANGEVWAGTGCCGGDRRFHSGDLGADTVELGKWQHFVFTYNDVDATWGHATLYKNGQPLVNRNLRKGGTWAAFDLRGGGNGLDGLVDEVAVYDYALDADQVAAHFFASQIVPEPATLAVWMGLLGLGLWAWRRRR